MVRHITQEDNNQEKVPAITTNNNDAVAQAPSNLAPREWSNLVPSVMGLAAGIFAQTLNAGGYTLYIFGLSTLATGGLIALRHRILNQAESDRMNQVNQRIVTVTADVETFKAIAQVSTQSIQDAEKIKNQIQKRNQACNLPQAQAIDVLLTDLENLMREEKTRVEQLELQRLQTEATARELANEQLRRDNVTAQATITTLRTTITAQEAKIAQQDERIQELEKQLEASRQTEDQLKSQIQQLGLTINQRNSQIDALNAQVAKLTAKDDLLMEKLGITITDAEIEQRLKMNAAKKPIVQQSPITVAPFHNTAPLVKPTPIRPHEKKVLLEFSDTDLDVDDLDQWGTFDERLEKANTTAQTELPPGHPLAHSSPSKAGLIQSEEESIPAAARGSVSHNQGPEKKSEKR